MIPLLFSPKDWIFEEYKAISHPLSSGIWLQVNFHKSSFIGIHTQDSWLQSVSASLFCKTDRLLFTYLGLPVGKISSRISSWESIIAMIQKKLLLGKTIFSQLEVESHSSNHLSLISLYTICHYFPSLREWLQKSIKFRGNSYGVEPPEKIISYCPLACRGTPKRHGEFEYWKPYASKFDIVL